MLKYHYAVLQHKAPQYSCTELRLQTIFYCLARVVYLPVRFSFIGFAFKVFRNVKISYITVYTIPYSFGNYSDRLTDSLFGHLNIKDSNTWV